MQNSKKAPPKKKIGRNRKSPKYFSPGHFAISRLNLLVRRIEIMRQFCDHIIYQTCDCFLDRWLLVLKIHYKDETIRRILEFGHWTEKYLHTYMLALGRIDISKYESIETSMAKMLGVTYMVLYSLVVTYHVAYSRVEYNTYIHMALLKSRNAFK